MRLTALDRTQSRLWREELIVFSRGQRGSIESVKLNVFFPYDMPLYGADFYNSSKKPLKLLVRVQSTNFTHFDICQKFYFLRKIWSIWSYMLVRLIKFGKTIKGSVKIHIYLSTFYLRKKLC